MDWDIFKEKVDVIVNAVNIVGVMGRGLALQFRQVYGEEYFDSYRADCEKAARNISAFNSTYTAPNGQIVYNFATKKDWRDPSSLEIIGIGLDKLAAWLGNRDISIAIPQLGCGCGGLSWTTVRPLIVNKLSSVKANVCLDGVWLEKGEKMDKIIGPFKGDDYGFLSNMYPTKVTTDLGTFTCAEAAFQACKCANADDVEKFTMLEGKDAKALGGRRGLYKNGRFFRIALRPNWDEVRLEKMLEVVRAKFSNPTLAERLVETGNAELVEINYWGDEFWGAVDKNGVLVGKNHLGKILMKVRAEIINGDKQEFRQAATTDVNAEENKWNDIFSSASVTLSDEQKQVVRDIVTDIKLSDVPTTNLIVGNAGVGKTTVLACLQKAFCTFFDAQVGADIAICAPTNKACKVLVEKGLEKAETVHSRFMQPSRKNGRLEFESSDHGCPLKYCVIDEASMLSSRVLNELQNYQKYKKTHFVFVGDNFQLPPVEETNNDVFARYGNFTRRLTKVFRQAQGSEILDLATALRTKEMSFFPTTSCGQVELLPYGSAVSEYVDALQKHRSAVAIVNSNKERNRVNAHIREKLGYGVKPVEGEHLISVANATNLTNGETFELHDITFCEPVTVWLDNEKNGVDGYCVVDHKGYRATLLLTEYNKASAYHQQIANVKGSAEAIEYLCNPSPLDRLTNTHQPEIDTNIAYYGYAITAHKAQGSQWDEVFLLQTQNYGNRDSARWLYTAVTRAAKRLVIADDRNVAHKDWEEIHQILGDDITTKKGDIMKPAIVGFTERSDPAFSNSWIKGAKGGKSADECDFVILISKGMPKDDGKKWMLDNAHKCIFHATVTGWGGDKFMEPGVKPFAEQLQTVRDFIDKEGFPADHVVIRIDPIWPTAEGVEKAKAVLAAAQELGFKKFRYSYLDPYKSGYAYFARNDRKQMFLDMINDCEGTRNAILAWNTACFIAEKYHDCEFSSCAEGVAPKSHHRGCVSAQDYELCKVDTKRIDTSTPRQRKTCLCEGNKTELFPKDMKGKCGHRCAYCYWPHCEISDALKAEWKSIEAKVKTWQDIFNGDGSGDGSGTCVGDCSSCHGKCHDKKEDKIVEPNNNTIKIISNDEMKDEIWATVEGTATQAYVIKTYGNPAKAPALVQELDWTTSMIRKANVKLDVYADGVTLTKTGFNTAKQGYIKHRLSNVDDSVFKTLCGKTVFVQQWQVAGLIARLHGLSLQFTVNGEVVTPLQTAKKATTASTAAAKFTIADKIDRLGEGTNIMLSGKTSDYLWGQGKSIIILPNRQCAMADAISDIESNKPQKEHPAVTTGDWFEARFVVLQDNEVIKTVYAFVAASNEYEAREIIDAWVARNDTRANGWSTDNNRIPEGLFEYGAFVKVLGNKNNPKARIALAEALRTAKKFESAEVGVDIDPSDIKRMVKEQCLALCGNEIASLKGSMEVVVSLAQQLGGTIADLEKRIDTLEADNAALKADNAALKNEIAALKAEETRETKAAKTDEPTKPELEPEPTPVVVPEQESEKHEPMEFNRDPDAFPDESETEQQTSVPEPDTTTETQPTPVAQPEPAPVQQQQPDMTAIEVTEDEIDIIKETVELPEIVDYDVVNPHAHENSIKAREEKAARVKVVCAALGIKLDELDNVMYEADLFVNGCDYLYDMKVENGNVYVQQTRQPEWKQIKYEGGKIVVH